MFHVSSLLKSSVLTAAVCFAAATAMAHGRTHTKAVRSYAEEMIRDHLAVNNKVLAMLDKLKVEPEGNDTSKSMYKEASRKRGSCNGDVS